MDTAGCPDGSFSDQLFVLENDCRQSQAAWIVFAFFIGFLNIVDVFMISFLWIRSYRTRRAYVQVTRRNFCCKTRLPIVPLLRVMFLVVTILFIFLASFNVLSIRDGSSVVVISIGLFPLFVYHYIAARQYLRLGLQSIPLAKRLVTSSNSESPAQAMTDSSSTRPPGLTLTKGPSFLTLVSSRDLSKLSPISHSVRIRFYVWTWMTVARSILGVIFIPAFPEKAQSLLTASYAVQVVADVSVSFMVSQLNTSVKALDGILQTSSNPSNQTQFAPGGDSRLYLRVLRVLIGAQIVISLAMHIPVMIGYRSWYVVFIEPASLSVFHILHTLVLFFRMVKRKKPTRHRQHANANEVAQLNDKVEIFLGRDDLDLVPGDKPTNTNQNPKSNVKGIRSDGNGNHTAGEEEVKVVS